MRRKLLIGLLLAVALPFAGAPLRSVEPERPPFQRPEQPPLVDGWTGATRRYLPVRFTSHELHTQFLDCRRCHHRPSPSSEPPRPAVPAASQPHHDIDVQQAPADSGRPERCHGCHQRESERELPGKLFHDLCRDCHRQEAVREPPGPPTTCLGCHQERP